MIKLTDIYWVAAFLDGEGTFCFNSSNSPRIQVTSTDLDLLQMCKSRMEIDSNIYLIKRYQSHHKQSYGMSISGSLSISWMMTLYSILCDRRKEDIKNIIREWKVHKSFNLFNDEMCPNGHVRTKRNTIYEGTPRGTVVRKCKTCKARNQRLYKMRKRTKLLEA